MHATTSENTTDKASLCARDTIPEISSTRTRLSSNDNCLFLFARENIAPINWINHLLITNSELKLSSFPERWRCRGLLSPLLEVIFGQNETEMKEVRRIIHASDGEKVLLAGLYIIPCSTALRMDISLSSSKFSFPLLFRFLYSLCVYFSFLFSFEADTQSESVGEKKTAIRTRLTFIWYFCWWPLICSQTLLRFGLRLWFLHNFIGHLAVDLMVDPWDCFPLAFELHRLTIWDIWKFSFTPPFIFQFISTFNACSCLCTTSDTSLSTDRRVSPSLELQNDVLC